MKTVCCRVANFVTEHLIGIREPNCSSRVTGLALQVDALCTVHHAVLLLSDLFILAKTWKHSGPESDRGALFDD